MQGDSCCREQAPASLPSGGFRTGVHGAATGLGLECWHLRTSSGSGAWDGATAVVAVASSRIDKLKYHMLHSTKRKMTTLFDTLL